MALTIAAEFGATGSPATLRFHTFDGGKMEHDVGAEAAVAGDDDAGRLTWAFARFRVPANPRSLWRWLDASQLQRKGREKMTPPMLPAKLDPADGRRQREARQAERPIGADRSAAQSTV